MHTYYEYITRNFINTNDSYGDLARYLCQVKDMFPDATEPTKDSLRSIRLFLNDKHVPDGVMRAFEYSWEDYSRCKKKKSKRSSSQELKSLEA